MNQDNWYEASGWYEPLRQPRESPAPQPAPEPEEKKKRPRWPWILGSVLLSLALIIGLSVALREPESASPSLPEFRLPHAAERSDPEGDSAQSGDSSGKSSDKSENKPSYREYFDSIYNVEASSSVQVNIPRFKGKIPFRLELESTAEDLSLQQLYEQCCPSVVGISGYVNGRLGYSWGTGVILSPEGLIITNTHVVDGCDRAVVTLYDDREYEATLVGFDSISDIAVLKIEATGLPAAVFGDSAALTVGQRVAAIGNPLGEQFRMTLTDGILSGIARDINYKGRTMTLLQTNAALNSGNSGGPLFNMAGQVIGITNMKMDAQGTDTTIEGIGFAIPTGTVLSVVNAILDKGKVEGRVSIGITVGPIPESAAEDYQLPQGLYIVSVERGSDAEAKGLQAGDILMEVNGEPVTETKRLAEIKDQFSVGDELLFKIWRDGRIFEVSVALLDTNEVYG